MATPKRKESNECTQQSNISDLHSFTSVSPKTQISYHAAGNLTGELRKVKDIAADFHNQTLKWASFNALGIDIVTHIGNFRAEKMFKPLTREDDVTMFEINSLCNKLYSLVEDMEKIVQKLKGKFDQVEGLKSLRHFQKSESRSSLMFSTMTLDDVSDTLSCIYASYAKELSFKQQLVREVAHAESREASMLYTLSWLHQPYLDGKVDSSLAALLRETGHVK